MSILLLLLLIFASEVTGQLATEDSEDVQVWTNRQWLHMLKWCPSIK
jgi:hypothetical protein